MRNPWIPHRPTERQAAFLLSPAKEALYGGATGGGKSDALLMGAAQDLDRPGYAALLLRRTFRDLNQPDALIPRSKEWWTGKADWNQQDKRWTFPSGATITFGYLDSPDDVYQYQGAAYQYVGFDELTQFPEGPYRYLFSRLRRRAGVDVPLRMRAGSNPGGVGHEWVKARFVKPAGEAPSRVFVPALLRDNPHLDAAAYVEALAELDPITRAQLLAGDWEAYVGGRFKRAWFRRYGRHGTGYRMGPPHSTRIYTWDQCPRFATVDPAASAKETAASDDPDYTVVSAWCTTPQHELVWLDCVRVRKEIPDIVPVVQAVYDRWQLQYVAVEAVAANRAVYQLARRTRMAVREVSPGGVDKLVRATRAIVLAESGRLYLPEQRFPYPDSCPLEDAEAELLRFTGDEKQDAHDDVVDTVAYAAILATTKEDASRAFKPYVAGG